MAMRRSTTLNVKNLVPSDPNSRVGTGHSSCVVPPNRNADFMYMENVLPTFVALKICTFYRKRHKSIHAVLQTAHRGGAARDPSCNSSSSDRAPLVMPCAPSSDATEGRKRKRKQTEKPVEKGLLSNGTREEERMEHRYVFQQTEGGNMEIAMEQVTEFELNEWEKQSANACKTTQTKQKRRPQPIQFVECPRLREILVRRFFPNVPDDEVIPCLELRVSPNEGRLFEFLDAHRKKHGEDPSPNLWKDRVYKLTNDLVHVHMDNTDLLRGKKHDIDTGEQHWNKKQANHSNASSKGKRAIVADVRRLADQSDKSSDPELAITLIEKSTSAASKIWKTPARIKDIIKEAQRLKENHMEHNLLQNYCEVTDIVQSVNTLRVDLLNRLLHVCTNISAHEQGFRHWTRAIVEVTRERSRETFKQERLLHAAIELEQRDSAGDDARQTVVRRREELEKAKNRERNEDEIHDDAYEKWIEMVVHDGGLFYEAEQQEKEGTEVPWSTPLAGDAFSRILLDGQPIPVLWRKGNSNQIPNSDNIDELKKKFSNRCADGDWGNTSKIASARMEAESTILRLEELKKWIEANNGPFQGGRRFALKPVALLMENHTPTKQNKRENKCYNPKGTRNEYDHLHVSEYQSACDARLKGEHKIKEEMAEVFRNMAFCIEQGFLHAFRNCFDFTTTGLHSSSNTMMEAASLYVHRMLSVADCFGAVKDVDMDVSSFAPSEHVRLFDVGEGVVFVYNRHPSSRRLFILNPLAFVKSSSSANNRMLCFALLARISLDYEPHACKLLQARAI